MVCTFCTPHHTYPVHSLNNDLDGPLHIIQSKQWTPGQRQYPGSTTCYTFQANIVDNLEMLYSYSHSLTENLFLSRFVFQITFFQAYLIRLWDYLYVSSFVSIFLSLQLQGCSSYCWTISNIFHQSYSSIFISSIFNLKISWPWTSLRSIFSSTKILLFLPNQNIQFRFANSVRFLRYL